MPSAGTGATLAGGGEMGALMRSLEWSATPLGAVEDWPQSLRTMVRILLANRFPLLLWWGPEHLQLYNDAYRPVLGSKHPRSMVQPAQECFPEIWHIIGPLIETPYHGGPSTWDDDLFLEVNRHGFSEETHFTVAYSPVPDDSAAGGIGGVLATVHEITQQVIQERRVAALRDLGARSSEAKSAEEACAVAAEALSHHPKDVPFILLYLVDAEKQTAHLAGAAGLVPGQPAAPTTVDLAAHGEQEPVWPLAGAMRTGEPQDVDRLQERLGGVPCGPWSDPPDRAVVLPVPSNIPQRWAGLLVFGISARLAFDDAYRGFCELATAQVAAAIANARAYEAERERSEALAELDRAKTAFFSNVSHEFRTPLTLMLGPLEELLAKPSDGLLPENRPLVDSAHRNGLRLLKLVNSLLDFSRIEAGRVQASYQPTDLAAFSAELASTFRSAIEKVGLRLVLDCPPLPAPVYVDREMWEKILLNLLSNAFKFTFEGEIGVEVRPSADRRLAELCVRDTGTGIAAAELPRLFERFHRIAGARGRTFEGTGIGLALVQELVKLHGGTVSVESENGRGTVFTVSLPFGTSHLPAERIGAASDAAIGTTASAEAYVDEAVLWLPESPAAGSRPTASPFAPRVLLVDDNADMREYVQRLLQERYVVEAVHDGEAALAAAQARPPDLVLSDVMMPRLDGFGLVAALRNDPRTREVPIILLSARAGEEAKVEGLHGGADDYLVKPFAARELLARVETHLALARVRNETTDRERDARREAERLAAAEIQLRADLEQQMAVHMQLNEALREVDRARTVALTEAQAARQHLQEVFLQAPAVVAVLRGPEHVFEMANPVYLQMTGLRRENIGKPAREALPDAVGQGFFDLLDQVYATGEPFVGTEMPVYLDRSGTGVLEEVFFNFVYQPLRDAVGAVNGILAHGVDVTGQVRARQEVAASAAERARAERQREEFLAAAAHDLKTPLTGIQGSVQLLRRQMARPSLQSEEIAAILPLIEASTRKAASLIDELLDVSRLGTAGSLELHRSRVDLVEIVRRVLAEQQRASHLHHLRLEATVPSLIGQWDAARLERAIGNVIGNAIKYSPAGGEIHVELREERDGSAEASGATTDGVTAAGWRWAILAVTDHGLGIPSGELERIFDRFHRAENVKTQISGSGIGLSYVREIAVRHGGSVAVTSEEGRGSTFTLRLPCGA